MKLEHSRSAQAETAKTAPTPPAPRRWGRILAIVAAALIVGYLGLTSALWAYYSEYRKIGGVAWSDVVLLRFARVESAIGEHYFQQARDYWAQKDYVRAIFTDRVAVAKAPGNLPARLFLASAWIQAGRPEEGIRVLREGIAFNPDDQRLQSLLVEVCLSTSHYKDLIDALNVDFPAHGVRLLEGGNRDFQLADVRAILETGSPAAAAAAASGFTGFATDPRTAALMAEIDWQSGHQQAAIARLRAALARSPRDPSIENSLIDLLERDHQEAEARRASIGFFRQYPGLLAAQMHVLEAFGSRQGADAAPWNEVCIRMLRQHQHDPDALSQLASLAASRGWTDLTYLLYENSLYENLSGFPFVVYYAASLVKTGDLAKADAIWRELAVRNETQIDSSLYILAMVDWGTGRESDALQILDRLRRETADDRRRRKLIQAAFNDYGFPRLAVLLGG